jgi:hypothetical protein
MTKHNTKLTKTEREKYIKMLWFYRKYPVLAARDILGVKLSPHQRIVFKKIWASKEIALVMSRGMSKTFILAVVALLYAALYLGMKVLIASGQSFRQGQMVLDECDKIATGTNPSVEDRYFARRAFGVYEAGKWKVLKRGQNDWSIEQPGGGSSIRTFPMKNTEAIRGYRAHVVLLDERNAISDETYQKAISPFANVKRDVLLQSTGELDNRFVHAGTVEYTWQGFAKLIRSFLKDGLTTNRTVIEFNYEDSYKYGINWEKIEKERDSDEYDFGTWLAENKNQLKEDSDTYYGGRLILQEAIAPFVKFAPIVKKNKCFMGIDPARQKDSFAITILKEDKVRGIYPVYQYRWEKTDFQEIVNKIFKLVDDYNVVSIGVDIGGGGYQVRDLLLKPQDSSYAPIWDPSDDDAEAMLGDKKYSSKKILTLLKPNAQRNTQWNSHVKAMLQSGKLRFTDLMFVPRCGDKNEEKVMKCMVESKRQFVMVKTKSSISHTNLSFYVEGIKKDLYSSVLYAVTAYKEYMDKNIRTRNQVVELPMGGWI